jgi:peptidyl-prolyl cis-trans isomerase A (cyclophilin A)
MRVCLGICLWTALAGVRIFAQETPPAPADDAPSLRPQVVMETSLGEILIELDAEKAPLTVMNFLEYAESGWYNDTIFHRVVKGRMIHGGGYTDDLKLKAEGLRDPVKYEGNNGLNHARGTIGGFRRFDNLDSAQSQFFINTADNANLDRLKDGTSYVVFGRVLDGMETVDKIENVAVGTHPKLADGLSPYVPQNGVKIRSVKIKKRLDRTQAESIAALHAEAAADPVGFRTRHFENECKSKAVQTRTGLKFIECKPGTGAFPMGPDTVTIYVVGTLTDGTEFENSKNRGPGPMSVKVEESIRGLREGLQKMREGARFIFVVPSDLGFGAEGVPGKVPPEATLFFDVTLEAVQPAP